MTFTPAIRVLLVEPHADSRELYVLGLTKAGFEVFAAEDGASATLAFAAHAPAIAVSDTRLPDMSAAELLARFSDAGVPVIALTTDPQYQHHARSARLSAVLLKPCFADEVAAAIRRALGVASHGGGA
jgi:two-component system, OmpR family, response regulator